MTVTLIITTYNRQDALAAVLASVLAQTRLPDEVLVADDGSGPATQKVIQSCQAQTTLPIHHLWQEDLGFRAARSRNMAIARARGEYLIFIDGDILLEKHFIEDHCHQAAPGLFIQGGRVLLDPQATARFLQQTRQTTPSLLTPGLSGRHKMIHSPLMARLFSTINRQEKGSRTCNFSLWRQDAVKVNGFNEAFQGWGREDSEFVMRLFFLGLKRKKLIFNGIGFHLFHPIQSRQSLPANDEILRQTIAAGQPRCGCGLDSHQGGAG